VDWQPRKKIRGISPKTVSAVLIFLVFTLLLSWFDVRRQPRFRVAWCIAWVMQEGEPVEFTTMEDPSNGKIKAQNVTGPMGAYVQGAPRRMDNFGNNDGYGSGGGGGFRNDGF
jgi:hypothetical protein